MAEFTEKLQRWSNLNKVAGFEAHLQKMFRSSHRSCFIKKATLKDFALFRGKDLQACNFNKQSLQHKCFSVKFTKFLRAPICSECLGNCFYAMVECLTSRNSIKRFSNILKVKSTRCFHFSFNTFLTFIWKIFFSPFSSWQVAV